MARFNLNNCMYEFASDSINIIIPLYDVSGSMAEHVDAMLKANKAFYDDFSKFEERGSIAIAKGVFASGFDMTSFDSVKKFSTNYEVGGGTALYKAIVLAGQNTISYFNELEKRLNIRARITFLVFSDGGDNESEAWQEDARNIIKELNSLDATTVFVAFDGAISARSGERLGFTCTKDIINVQELISCMGTELSRSCKEQSKSAYSLKSEFFSKATQNTEEDTTEVPEILDDEFFTGII